MKHQVFFRSRKRIIASLATIALLVALLPLLNIRAQAAGASGISNNTQSPSLNASITFVRGVHIDTGNNSIPIPPTDKFCRTNFNFPCYSPQEMQNAYGLTPLLKKGFDGKGQTIVIIVPFGSPTIKSDLHNFDLGYGLPDPPSFKIITPLGTKPYQPTAQRVNWATETTLDVSWSHAMAPGANIVLLTCPTNDFKQLLYLLEYAVDRHLGNIISQSWAATENTFFNPYGTRVLQTFNQTYKQAADEDITAFAASGDTGVANPNNQGNDYPFPTVNFPASDPYVTTIGGTFLHADTQGNYQSENAWNDQYGSTGGGVSQYFKEPQWQESLNSSDQHILNGYRGLPDIAYNSEPDLLYYSGFPGQPKGWTTIGGTSAGPPQWSGIIADADQYAGEPLGFLSPMLYQLGSNGQQNIFHDITVGNNSFDKIQGYSCTKGWDPVTGWGSPQAANLINALNSIKSTVNIVPVNIKGCFNAQKPYTAHH